MIIEMTKDIVQSIVAIPEVVSWVAKVGAVPNVSANKLPGAFYPAIAVYELENDPEMYADDEEQTSFLTFQISLFSKDGSHGTVQNLIDKKMKELGFIRGTKIPLLFDTDNNISNRVLLYSQEIEHSLYK
ncbi:hypothetical protein CKN96_15755 [Carnobacterium maltaromaticum]|uniref:hypothetical protein n=1 Tax=Carnobacterium maltaromaticum TaxID=2751 RepID=UPI001072F9D1|nr:hypothetical protein [Carnobacterium maltaromaticum]TFJ56037.1 hypothetical protein CKN96_15755 [Carnobacterium maltaromaticum]